MLSVNPNLKFLVNTKTPVDGMMKVFLWRWQNRISIAITNGSFKYNGKVEAPYVITLFAELKNVPSELRAVGVVFFVDSKPTIVELDTLTRKTSRFNYIDTKVTFLQKSIFQEKLDLLRNELSDLNVSKEEDKKKGEEIVLANIAKNKSEKERSILINWNSRFLSNEKILELYNGFSDKTKASFSRHSNQKCGTDKVHSQGWRHAAVLFSKGY